MLIELCYAVYVALSLGVTIWVARTLERNGRRFLIEAFQGDEGMADSVNRLLVVGFYLVNIGFVTLALHTYVQVATLREAIELVSDKFGFVLVVLGMMHFLNLYIFNRMRRRGRAEVQPPLLADARIPPPIPGY
ncbi:MAG: hypothetical protein ABI823_12485 [Bryobacteraceae bacterium]